MILAADKAWAWSVEGLSFHRRQPDHQLPELRGQAINLAANLFKEARDRGYTKMNLLDIGGGFPAPYDDSVKPFRELAKVINREFERLFPEEHPDTRRAGPVPRARRPALAVSKIIGKAVRDGKLCYYINDGVYHTFSGVIFRPLPLPPEGLQEAAPRASLLRVRPHLRRARCGFHGRATSPPTSKSGRPALQREHRRLQPRLLHLVQRLCAGEGRARESVKLGGRMGVAPRWL
jgi:hypothetical protein